MDMAAHPDTVRLQADNLNDVVNALEAEHAPHEVIDLVADARDNLYTAYERMVK